MPGQGIDCPADQFISDEFIEPGRDNPDTQPFRRQFSFQYFHFASPSTFSKCPILSFLTARYFLLKAFALISTGTRSVIVRP